jgi:domain of unknown function (DUF1083)
MKKRTTRLIAVCLFVFQVALVFGGISAFAGLNTYEDLRSYNIYRVDPSKMTADGVVGADEPWEKVPFSEPVRAYWQNLVPDETPAKFKALWGSDASGAYLYFWAELNDPDGTYNNGDIFQFLVDETGKSTDPFQAGGSATGPCRRTTILSLREETKTVGNWFEYTVKRTNDGKDVTVEAKYTFSDAKNAAANAEIGLDFLTDRKNSEGAMITQWAWCNYESQTKPNIAGRATLKKINAVDLGAVVDEDDDAVFYNAGLAVASCKKDENGNVTLPAEASGAAVCAWKNRTDNKLYAAGSTYKVSKANEKFDAVTPNVALLEGARVRLATTGALKFEGTIEEFDDVKDYVKKVGILFVKTADLTEEIAGAGATPASLTAAGITFQKAEADAAASFEGVLENLTDKNEMWSALPYVTVELADGTTTEFAGTYTEENNSRSVAKVAQAAYEDRSQLKDTGYKNKVGSEFGVTGFEVLSFSPYNKTELAILKKIFAE